MKHKIAAFPEPGAIGPAMNLIGISQGLRDLGHEVVFILEPGLKGTASEYGFEERYLSCMPPMSEEEQARYWDDFMVRYLPSFRTSPTEQVATYVKACWDAIVDTSRWSVKNGLDKVIADIGPDLVVNDNVIVYPATQNAGCPWVRVISCSENEISDPLVPPHLSGCAVGDKVCAAAFKAEFSTHIKPLHDEFKAFLRECGYETPEFPDFVQTSPYLNLLLYPKPLQFERENPLDPNKFVYLDGCVRKEAVEYVVPAFKSNPDGPLIYLSFGSLGGSDVQLIKRIIGLLGTTHYRVLANVGDNLDEYKDVPDNVIVDKWFPQVAVLPHVDLFIQHGGNNSFNESFYFGIPALVMPFVWDGHDNAQRASDTGHGIGMSRYEWSDDEMLNNIERLMTDPEIRRRVMATSAFMQSHDGKSRAANAIDNFLRSNLR